MARSKVADLQNELMRDPVFAEQTEDQRVRVKIGNLIRRTREAGGRTQQWLSEVSGVDQADISKIECGYRMPTIETLTRLAHALDMQIRVEMTTVAADAGARPRLINGLYEVI